MDYKLDRSIFVCLYDKIDVFKRINYYETLKNYVFNEDFYEEVLDFMILIVFNNFLCFYNYYYMPYRYFYIFWSNNSYNDFNLSILFINFYILIFNLNI